MWRVALIEEGVDVSEQSTAARGGSTGHPRTRRQFKPPLLPEVGDNRYRWRRYDTRHSGDRDPNYGSDRLASETVAGSSRNAAPSDKSRTYCRDHSGAGTT